MNDVPNEWNSLTEAIIGAAIDVHSALGPGLLERFYEQAMAHELECRRIPFQRQHPIRLRYKTVELGEQFIDLVVGGLVVVELKSVERVHDTHLAQLVAYMRSAKLPLGLLINFNCARLKDGLFRRVDSIRTPAPPSMLVEIPAAQHDGRGASPARQLP
ncbi:MAG: GxxExxY protein [Phycisphaerales bacterium]|nr:GxxExxY protein [Phycisphaerales bacterium]